MGWVGWDVPGFKAFGFLPLQVPVLPPSFFPPSSCLVLFLGRSFRASLLQSIPAGVCFSFRKESSV